MYNPQLDTFLAVVNTGSFSKAASYLYVTPSAVIQQINSLEARMKVQLFYRTNKGAILTKQGIYLKTECEDYIKKGKEIQEKLLQLTENDYSFTMGTSLREKCRIFYDFWIRFNEKSQNSSVELKTIDTDFPIPAEIDIIESIYSNAPWQAQWPFLKLCDIPYGIAAARDHPLYRKKSLNYNDLGEFIIILQRGWGELDLSKIKKDLIERGIRISERKGFGGDVVWDASIHKKLIVLPMCFQDVLFDMNIKPMSWNHTVPYGFFYRPNLSGLTDRFISFVKEQVDKNPEVLERLNQTFPIV
jgi:hypothetical protein